jgi:hypothetical protein
MHKIYYFYHFKIQDEILSSFMHTILYIINHKNDMIKKKKKRNHIKDYIQTDHK